MRHIVIVFIIVIMSNVCGADIESAAGALSRQLVYGQLHELKLRVQQGQ